MAVITVSRQVGSGGDEIARRACEVLGYRYFDKRLIAALASEMGLLQGDVVDFTEYQHEARGFLDRLLPGRTAAAGAVTRADDGADDGATTVEELDEETTLGVVEGAIRAASKLGDIVIVGRGGQHVLRDEPGVLHVRIVAPLEDRVERVAQREHVDDVTARETWIAQGDAASSDYLHRSYGIDWADPLHYHLVINTARWGTEAAAQLIARAVDSLPADQA